MSTQSNAKRRLAGAAGMAVMVAVLGACGGHDHNEPDATSEVPASASQSIDGFIAYLKRLVVSDADALEPVDTASVTPPTDETSEPQPVP